MVKVQKQFMSLGYKARADTEFSGGGGGGVLDMFQIFRNGKGCIFYVEKVKFYKKSDG